MMSNGRTFTAEYKAKIALEMERGLNTVGELAAREGVGSGVLNSWRRELEANAHRAFSVTNDEKQAMARVREVEERERDLMVKVGQLSMECDWLKKKYEQTRILTENGSGRRK